MLIVHSFYMPRKKQVVKKIPQVKTKTFSITNTQLALATVAALFSSGFALASIPQREPGPQCQPIAVTYETACENGYRAARFSCPNGSRYQVRGSCMTLGRLHEQINRTCAQRQGSCVPPRVLPTQVAGIVNADFSAGSSPAIAFMNTTGTYAGRVTFSPSTTSSIQNLAFRVTDYTNLQNVARSVREVRLYRAANYVTEDGSGLLGTAIIDPENPELHFSLNAPYMLTRDSAFPSYINVFVATKSLAEGAVSTTRFRLQVLDDNEAFSVVDQSTGLPLGLKIGAHKSSEMVIQERR